MEAPAQREALAIRSLLLFKLEPLVKKERKLSTKIGRLKRHPERANSGECARLKSQLRKVKKEISIWAIDDRLSGRQTVAILRKQLGLEPDQAYTVPTKEDQRQSPALQTFLRLVDDMHSLHRKKVGRPANPEKSQYIRDKEARAFGPGLMEQLWAESPKRIEWENSREAEFYDKKDFKAYLKACIVRLTGELKKKECEIRRLQRERKRLLRTPKAGSNA